MRKQKTGKISKQLLYVLLILLLSLSLTQTVHITHAATVSSNPWGIKLQILNWQDQPANVFSPFDFVQLCANVTYDNASQPDVLVAFNVIGPSPNPINISAIQPTQANGGAEFSFRLPIEAQSQDSINGTWNATATISGAPSQSESFTTQWTFETATIKLLNPQNHNQTSFYPGNNVAVQVEIKNNGPAEPANITLDMQDSAGRIINQTEILNTQIANSNQTQVQTTLQIPQDTIAGKAAINVTIFNGDYNGRDIPAAENQTAYFTIISNKTTTQNPTTSPTPSPNILQNSVSLFSWLLVATGLFTFTMLYMFLRRKPTDLGSSTPNIPPVMPSPAIPTVTPTESTTLQTTAKQPPPPKTPTTNTAPQNIAQATMHEQGPTIYDTVQSQNRADSYAPNKPDSKPFTSQESAEAIAAHLGRIAETGTKVQALEATLKGERDRLDKEVADLNKILEEQEKAIKSYFDSIRQAVATATNTQLRQVKDAHNTQPPQKAKDEENSLPTEARDKNDNQPTQNFESPQGSNKQSTNEAG